MKKTTMAFIAAAAFAMSGCSIGNTLSYTTYSFDMLRPADYVLPASVEKVAVVCCASPYSIVSDSLQKEYSKERLDFIKRMPGITCNVLTDYISKSDYMKAVQESSIYSPAKLTANVDSLCKKHKADALLVLTDYKMDGKMFGFEAYGQACLSRRRTLTSAFALVMPGGASRNFETRNDTLEWVFCGDTYDDTYYQFPDLDATHFEMAEHVAQTFAEQIIPIWQRKSGRVYASKNIMMQDALTWVRKGEWDKARDLWLAVYSQGKVPDKAYSALDIALYYERQDDAVAASVWCSKALDEFQKPEAAKASADVRRHAQQLFEQSLRRIDEKRILDRQMGAKP